MKRSFDAEFMIRGDDGRTVDGRIIPYGEVAQITERHDGQLVTFKERFSPRSCDNMIRYAQQKGNASFVSLLLEHDEDSFDAKIGHATSLRDEQDGVHATFRLYGGRDLEKVQSMLTESHTGLSVSFKDTNEPKLEGDVYVRTQIFINHVAATPVPCYESAAILGMRGNDADMGTVLETIGTPLLSDVQRWLSEVGLRKADV